jgi:hypothetical protein
MKGRTPVILLVGFLLLNLISAWLMPIQEDEAYYWMYAQNLDWGYFDHPPMVALMIKMGTAFFGGEFGTRIISTLLSILTCFVIWQMVPQKSKKQKGSVLLFLLIILSIPLFHVYGFITTPDVPLLFFSALYLLVFKNFLQKTSWVNTFKLGIAAALLLFSKYHGALVIFFALLPNLKLLGNKKLYVAGLTGLLFFFPHILWQYHNDFVTFRYHLFGRVENQFLWKNVMNYVLNTFLVLNPLFVGLVLYQSIIKRKSLFNDKTLLFVFWGGLFFFALSSVRDHVEPHWITFTSIPLVLMIHEFVLGKLKLYKPIVMYGLVSLTLLVLVRLAIVLPFPWQSDLFEFQNDYFYEIDSLSGDAKVAYVNSYPKSAMHTFYTGSPAFSYNCVPYGKKQYDYWNYEDSYNDQDVFLVGNWHSTWFDTLKMKSGHPLLYNYVEHFPVISKAELEVLEYNELVRMGEENPLSLQIHNPNKFDLNFNKGPLPISIRLYFRNHEGNYYSILKNYNLDKIKPGETKIIKGTFVPDFPADEYRMIVSLKPGYLYAVALTPGNMVQVVDNKFP